MSLGPGSSTQWVHGDTLQFAVSLKADGRHVLHIKELHPTSTPPLHTISSFPITPCDGGFFFSPVSFHASFATETEIVILDIQNSKLLLQTQLVEATVWWPIPVQFSPNGCFFACGTSGDQICIWQNTPTGYLPWSNHRLRLPFIHLCFSPTAAQIACCYDVIQVLHPGNNSGPPPPTVVHQQHPHQRHLVAYSTDGVHIAMARLGGSVTTVLDHDLGIPQQFINPDMETQDIKIVNNTLFVVDKHKLVCWDLEAGGTSDPAHDAKRVVINDTLDIYPDAKHLTLSQNCSQIAFTRGQTVFLCNLKAPGPLTKYISAYKVVGLQFSPDQHKLWLCTQKKTLKDGHNIYLVSKWLVELQILEGGDFKDVTTFQNEQLWWSCLSSHGHMVLYRSEWVVDSVGKKLLWLPPGWRTEEEGDMRWNSNFLALLNGRHPEPIIIQFYP